MANFDINYYKLYKPFSNDLSNPKISEFLKKILYDDRAFLYSVIIYSILISIFGIAVPISVQFLINSVSFTALLQPVIVLGIVLLCLLIFYGVLSAFQAYTVEIFQRRFLANMASRVCLQLVGASVKKLEEANVAELVNRFFDVMTIQKTVPKFLVKTVAFLLQTAIGLILVSFYHPFFLIFSVVFILCLYGIYALYFRKACATAFLESRRKYDIVGSLEDIANNTPIFKSKTGGNYAKFKINELTKRYLVDRKDHFKNLFSQTILLLILYAVASTFLLILGGYLVLKGQLTLGQLVAAELVLSAILYSMAQFGRDFENMYDLVAACEKLSIFFNIPLEEQNKSNSKVEDFKEISFENVLDSRDKNILFDFKLERGKRYLIHDKSQRSQQFFLNVLRDFERPCVGEIKVDKKSLYSHDMLEFRDQIKIIDSSQLIEGTLLENLTLGRRDIEKGQINQILKDLGLEDFVNKFEEKLNVRVIPSGWPFNEQQVVLIKIARALLFESKIIVANEILDILDYDLRQALLKYVCENSSAIFVYFSNHNDDNVKIFDKIMEI